MSALSIGIVLRFFCCCDFYVFVVCEFGVESQSYYLWVDVHGECGVVYL